MSEPYPKWRALKPGYLELGNEPFHITLHHLGTLPIPSGRLIIKDSNAFGFGPQRVIPTIPGAANLVATCIEQGEVSMLAYLSLEFQDRFQGYFQPLTPTYDHESEEQLDPSRRGGFVNRSGYAIVVDEELLKASLPKEDEHCFSMMCFWQNQCEDRHLPWEGALLDLPLCAQNPALVAFKTRRMSGLTPLWAELDDQGFLGRAHIDLGTMDRVQQEADRRR